MNYNYNYICKYNLNDEDDDIYRNDLQELFGIDDPEQFDLNYVHPSCNF